MDMGILDFLDGLLKLYILKFSVTKKKYKKMKIRA